MLPLAVIALSMACGYNAQAQFTNNTAVNTMVRDTAGLVGTTSLVATAANGSSFVVWAQKRPAGGYENRMQLIDKYGCNQWGPNGILIDSTTGTTIYRSELVVDKEGNAVYGTNNYRTGIPRPIVFKVNQAGQHVWGNAGIQLVDTTNAATFSGGPSLCITGDNNVVVSYYSEGTTKRYVTFEKFDPSGARIWSQPQHIIDLAASPKGYERPQAVATGDETFMMVYVKRNSAYSYQLYAQRFDASANPIWPDGVLLSSRSFPNNGYPYVAKDGYNGALVTFASGNPVNATIPDAFAQRVYSNGNLWNADGNEIVSTGTVNKYAPGGLAYDAASNNYIVSVPYSAVANAYTTGVVMQKLDTAGALLLTNTGVKVVSAATGANNLNAVNYVDFKLMDGHAAFFYTEGVAPNDQKILANRFDFSGNPVGSNPVIISNNASAKSWAKSGDYNQKQLVLAWIDTRIAGTTGNAAYNGGVYAQNLRYDGTSGIVCAPVSLAPFTFDSIRTSAPAFALTGGLPTGGTYTGTGVSNGMFDPAAAGVGTFTIQYIYADGPCTDTASQTIKVVSATSGLSSVNRNDLFECYPNPARQSVVVKTGSVTGKVKVRISGIDGRIWLSDEQTANGAYQQTFHLTGLAKGMYIVEVQAGNNVAASRLVVQ